MEDVLYYTKKSRGVVFGISPINTAATGRGPPRKREYACLRAGGREAARNQPELCRLR